MNDRMTSFCYSLLMLYPKCETQCAECSLLPDDYKENGIKKHNDYLDKIELKNHSEEHTERRSHAFPDLIKAGDTRVLLSGWTPLVDCRVISEDLYQRMDKTMKSLVAEQGKHDREEIYKKFKENG